MYNNGRMPSQYSNHNSKRNGNRGTVRLTAIGRLTNRKSNINIRLRKCLKIDYWMQNGIRNN